MEKRVLFDSTSDAYSYDAYEEWCEDDGLEPTYNDYIQWQMDELECDFDYLMGYFRREELDKCAVLISGTLGLWDGKHEIIPEKVDSINDAIDRMAGHSIEDYKISQIDRTTFEFEGYHHDGTNVYTFRFLKDEFYYTDIEELDLEGDIYEYAEETDY